MAIGADGRHCPTICAGLSVVLATFAILTAAHSPFQTIYYPSFLYAWHLRQCILDVCAVAACPLPHISLLHNCTIMLGPILPPCRSCQTTKPHHVTYTLTPDTHTYARHLHTDAPHLHTAARHTLTPDTYTRNALTSLMAARVHMA